jgi:predicted ATPase/transcriptional regulator with XRE-family HTH domain
MRTDAPSSFGARLKSLREAAGFSQEELATIAGLSVHAVSALERGQRRSPHLETVRALSSALDLPPAVRDAFVRAARTSARDTAGADDVRLPHVMTSLIGREADVAMLTDWIHDPAARAITLVGTGGVGKTRLALEIAHAVAEEQQTRVVFVGLASTRDAAFVAGAIAEAFGSADAADADLPGRVRAACEGRPTLLVLDNCEHVLDGMPVVARLLAATPSLQVLATSRTPLRIGGEREYPVGPLPLEADRTVPNRLAPAVQLFVDRAVAVARDFKLTGANALVVEAICRRLDALPLALELAAPWLKVLRPEDLLRHLHDDVLPPTLERRDLPERQQTMNATVAWSYQLLSADDQRTFRHLGILPGSFPIEAAAAVLSDEGEPPAAAHDTLQMVARLIERSLLARGERATGGRPLYRMLETVRAYAAIELAAAEETDQAMGGLARYCSTAAAAAGEHLTGHAQGEWLDRVRDDLETYRAAMFWLIERGRATEACDIASHLLFFWLIRGHAAEGLRWYDELAELRGLPSRVRAKALSGAAVMCYALGDLDRARNAGHRSLMLSDEADAGDVALAESMLGYVELAVGNLCAAGDRLTRALGLYETLGIAWALSNVQSAIAWTALAAGEFDEADRVLRDVAAHAAHAGPWFSGISLYVRAVLAIRHGKPYEAMARVRDSLTRIQLLNDRFALVYALVPLAAAAELTGDDAWAARILGARDGVTERTGATAVDESVRDLRQRVERDSRARLGARRWAAEYEIGRTSSVDMLLAEIDERCQKTTMEMPDNPTPRR